MGQTLRVMPFALALLASPSFAEVSPPRLRLGDAAWPVRYAAELTIVPGEEVFQGAIDIDVRLREPASLLWLNASQLTIEKATLSARRETVEAQLVDGGEDFAGLSFGRPVGPGPARLHLVYRGRVSRKDTAGLFQQKDGDEWYVYSQFEPTDARRAFPCFDEPSFKTPWQLRLRVRKTDVAVSNTPVVSEKEGPDGMKTVTFAETKPLPSYLIALGVGLFEFVDAGKAGRKPTPLRIVVPRGKSARARYAVEATGPILVRLEDYFGIPYPYEKLDSLVIPQTAGFGAMENVGLITYAESIILAKPEEETVGFKRGYAGTAAHEMAHHWFGDLVTLAWWDDTWLNEAFATWAASKTVIQWKPEWQGEVSRAASRAGVMGADSLVTARKIRQPIETKHDIVNAFDGITYTKGAAVLHMFESWLGEKAFQAGVRRYLARHAHGNATAGDFLQVIEAETKTGVATAFSTFLDQPGVPLVSVEMRCGEGGPPRLALSQKRFLPVGSKGAADQFWQVPVCVRYVTAKGEERLCRLVTTATAEIELPGAACPGRVFANDGTAGYYLASYPSELLTRLLAEGGKHLALPERVAVLREVNALASGGFLPRGEALALVPAFAKDPSRHVVAAAASLVGTIYPNLVPDEFRSNYARFIRGMFGERARELGFVARPGEDDDTRLLRQNVVGLVARLGEDPELGTEAVRLARRWLADRNAVPADMAGTVLTVAARNGDRALFELFRAEAGQAKERLDRQRVFGALASFRDPELAREALKLVLSDAFDFRETSQILFTTTGNPDTRGVAYAFVKDNFDAIVARSPKAVGDFGARLVFVGAGFCDEARRADVEAFFKDRAPMFTGGPRNLAQVLEGIGLCAAIKAAQEPAVRVFLERY